MDGFVQQKTLIPTHELYNVPGDIFLDMKYQDALALKIKLATKVIKDENKVHYMTRDSGIINRALSSIKHNEAMLKEMGLAVNIEITS